MPPVEIFLSWSGRRSKAAAEALRTWLPKVNPAFKPWLSTADIDKGARWASDVAERLEAARAGIIFLTPSNLHADWILWEAGALAKTIKNTYVCTLLIGLDPSDVKPPLSQFQATRLIKDDMQALLSTLNSKLEDRAIPAANLPETFALWWPKLEAELQKLPQDEDAKEPQRPERELIEEILALVRSQSRTVSGIPKSGFPRLPTDPDDPLADLISEKIREVSGTWMPVEVVDSGKTVYVRVTYTNGEVHSFNFPSSAKIGTIRKIVASAYDPRKTRQISQELSAPSVEPSSTGEVNSLPARVTKRKE